MVKAVATNGASTSSNGFGVFIVDFSVVEQNNPLTQSYGIDWASFNGLGVFNQFSTDSIFAVNSGISTCSHASAMKTSACGSVTYTDIIWITVLKDKVTVVGDYSSEQITHVLDATLTTPLDVEGTAKQLVVAAYSSVGNSDKISLQAIDFQHPSSTCSSTCTSGKVCVSGICKCSQGWSGGSCNVASCSQTCQNGGTCTYPNYCDCPESWGGPDCTKSYSLFHFFYFIIIVFLLLLSVKCLFMREITGNAGVIPAISASVQHWNDNTNCSWLITVTSGYAIEFVYTAHQ